MMDGTVRLHRKGRDIHHYTTSSFAELAVVPAQTAIKVDDDLPLTELALMGCAVMTGVGAVLNTAKVRPGDSVAVVGCGGVGLNIVQGAAIAAASRIVAIDMEPVKLDLARELGATETILASDGDTVEAVIERGGLVDYAFEAIGRPRTIELTTQLVRPGGEAILVGMAPPDARVSYNPLDLTLGEKAIRGCWYGSCRPPIDFPILLDLYKAGKLRLDLLVTPVHARRGQRRDGGDRERQDRALGHRLLNARTLAGCARRWRHALVGSLSHPARAASARRTPGARRGCRRRSAAARSARAPRARGCRRARSSPARRPASSARSSTSWREIGR